MRPSTFRLPSLLAAIVLAACGGDDGGITEPDLSPDNGTMTATIDGNSWTAIQIQIVRTSNLISIGASDAAPLALAISFQDLGTGTYTIGGGPIATANVSQGGTNIWQANGVQGSGSVVVTSISATSVAGTFEFTAVASQGSGVPATRVVTSGSFDVEFP